MRAAPTGEAASAWTQSLLGVLAAVAAGAEGSIDNRQEGAGPWYEEAGC